MLPEIKESIEAYEPKEKNIFDMLPVKNQASDYLPQRRIIRRKRSNIFKKSGSQRRLKVDTMAENIKIPFASFVDQKMVKGRRLVGIINKDIDSRIASITKRQELQTKDFLQQVQSKIKPARNSYFNINSRSTNHVNFQREDYEGPDSNLIRTNSTNSINL